jgi:hypothetical protein
MTQVPLAESANCGSDAQKGTSANQSGHLACTAPLSSSPTSHTWVLAYQHQLSTIHPHPHQKKKTKMPVPWEALIPFGMCSPFLFQTRGNARAHNPSSSFPDSYRSLDRLFRCDWNVVQHCKAGNQRRQGAAHGTSRLSGTPLICSGLLFLFSRRDITSTLGTT